MKRFYQIIMLHRLLLALFVCALTAPLAIAQPSEWKLTEFSQARLISAVTGIGGMREILLGFHVKLSPGWKTYWRSPGDSGIPPQFNWAGSTNIEKTQIFWPKPIAFDSFDLLTWGYKDEVVYLVKVTLTDPAQPLHIALELFYGICEEICIPVKQNFQLILPVDMHGVSPDAGIMEAFSNRIPVPVGEKSTVTLLAIQNNLDNLLKIEVTSTVDFETPQIILEGREGDFFTVKKIRILDNKRKAEFMVEVDLADKNTPLKGQDFTATILDATIAAEGHATAK